MLLGTVLGTILGLLMGFLSLFLVLLILIQRGRGGGITGALGGPGGQSAFGSKAGDTFTLITVVVATVWGLTCAFTMLKLGTHVPKMTSAPALKTTRGSDNSKAKGTSIPITKEGLGGAAESNETLIPALPALPDLGTEKPASAGPSAPMTGESDSTKAPTEGKAPTATPPTEATPAPTETSPPTTTTTKPEANPSSSTKE
jgi:preprotein translocase subunit SecG